MKKYILLSLVLPSLVLASKDFNFQYVDTFDSSKQSHQVSDYGLNYDRDRRQTYWNFGGYSWQRVSGLWNSTAVPPNHYSQVNQISNINTLSFHLGSSAVRLSKGITSTRINNSYNYNISFVADPVKYNTVSGNWVSFMLDNTLSSTGWVAKNDKEFGFLITAAGAIQIWERGTQIKSCSATKAESYKVNIDITGRNYVIKVNNAIRCSGLLNYAIPSSVYAYVGAAISGSQVSTFDEFSIKTARNSSKQLKHFGYYFTKGSPYPGVFNNFIDYLGGFTNSNHFAYIDDFTSDANQAYRNCYPKKCIVAVRMYSPSDNDVKDKLNMYVGGYGTVRYKDLVLALYVSDEPYWNGTPEQHLENRLQTLKSVTGMKTMVILSYKTLIGESPVIMNPSVISPYIDYIGFDNYDYYNVYGGNLIYYTNILKNKFPGKTYFSIPAATRCVFNGVNSDEDLARIQWGYYYHAMDYGITGILGFTPWQGTTCGVSQDPRTYAITYKTMQFIGEAITKDGL